MTAPDVRHVVRLTEHGWTCTCGKTSGDWMNPDIPAERELRNRSAEAHAYAHRGVLEAGGVKA